LFEGEKQVLFWVGLIILGFASTILFAILWQYAYIDMYMNFSWMFRQSFPIMVGAVVFIFIGVYMMKSGTKNPKFFY
jgi:ABC-type nickel/cobalt efflux system permease component RcnA